MSILKTKCFSGLGYINPKGKDRKIKKLERTYIKGKRGVKLYYDSTHYDEYEIDGKYDGGYEKYEVRKVFRKSIRREKLWNYFKYLEGKKIAVENLAIKFGVTERTIQNDVKFLIDGGYIERQTNKTTKGKQTKNSYITIKQYESNVLVKNSYLQVIYLAQKNNEWYVIARTDYDESKVKYKVRNIKDFTFTLPHKEVYSKNNIEGFSIEITEKVFSKNLQDKYQGIIFEHSSKHRYYKIDDYLHTKPKFKKIKCYFVLYKLDECLPCNKGFRWIKLSIAPKRIRDFKTNKGLHYVRKNILGWKLQPRQLLFDHFYKTFFVENCECLYLRAFFDKFFCFVVLKLHKNKQKCKKSGAKNATNCYIV